MLETSKEQEWGKGLSLFLHYLVVDITQEDTGHFFLMNVPRPVIRTLFGFMKKVQNMNKN